MACVFLAEDIQCTCDRKAATGSFDKGLKIKFNNCVAKWSLGACDTQELPLETTSMAGKFWQPSYEPPRGKEESRHPSH